MSNVAREKELLDAAIAYARLGMHVFPVHYITASRECGCGKSDCKSPGKHPLTQHGLNDATTDEVVICQFWQRYPQANIAIRTGKKSGIVVIEDDPRHGGDESYQLLDREIGKIPLTVTAHSGGGGGHRYFRHPGRVIKNRTSFRRGIDFRGDGGYIIAPPSNHMSGNEYKWVPGLNPIEFPLGEIPPRLLDVLTAKTDKSQESLLPSSVDSAIPEGQRNDTLFRLACQLFQHLSLEEVVIALSKANQLRCKPPLDDDEVEKIAKSANGQTSSAQDWGDPCPLPSLDAPVPALLESMLPSVLAPWIFDIAERMQIPPDFVAAPAIVALSSLIGTNVKVRPKAKDSWLENPNLWGAVVAPPGALKSPAMMEALSFLNDLQAKAMRDYVAKLQKYSAEEEATKLRVERIKKMAKSKDDPDLAKKLLEEQSKLELTKPAIERFVVNDATVEKLGEILRENPQGVLTSRDELFGLLISLEKKGSENARSFLLEGWSGKNSYTFDRVGRGTIYIPKNCISLFGGIQPDRLCQYFNAALSGGSGDDGFLSRFQILTYPAFSRDWSLVDRPPDNALRERAHDGFRDILRLRAIDPQGLVKEGIVFGFGPEAQQLFFFWYEALERRLRSGEIGSAAFQAHMSKYRSLMPSLALIFHLIDPKPSAEISLRATEMAVEWCKYLESHARKVYAFAVNPALAAAHEIIGKIKAGLIYDKMTVREIYRRGWSGLKSPDVVQLGLEELIQLGWVRVLRTGSEQGGRPSDVIRINPRVLSSGRSGGAS